MKLHLPKLLLTAVMAAVAYSSYALAAVEGPGTYASGTLPTLSGSITLTATEDTVWDATGLGEKAGVSFDINATGHNVKLLAPVNSNDRDISLNSVESASLWLASGCWVTNETADLENAGTIYLGGAQLQITQAVSLANNFVLGASTTQTQGAFTSLNNTALRVGHWQKSGQTSTLSGEIDVRENTRIAFQNGNHLKLTGTLKGSGEVVLTTYDGNNSLIISGTTTNFTGVVSQGQVQNNGSISLKLGNAAVQLGGLKGGLAVSLAEGTQSSTLTMNVAEGAAYTYTGSLGSGISIVKTGAGSQTLSGQTLSSDVTVSAGTLTLTNITTNGDIEIGGSGSLVIADTITNTGTLDLTASNISLGDSLLAYTVKKDGSVTYSVDTEKQNGFMTQNGAQLFLVQGGSTTVAEGAQASMGDTVYGLTSDDTGIWFTSGNYTSTSFYISDGDVEVIGSGAENATGAEKYVLQGGTMNLTAGTVNRSAIEYTSGAIATGNTAEISGLNSVTDATLIDHITGNGTLKVAETDTTGTNGYNGTITTSEGFSGKVYVTSGNFTLNGTTHGETIQLANGVNMQITENWTFEKNMILDSGDHQIHTNGKTLTISGNISGEGTLDKRASGSITIADGATIANYKHSAGTTNVTGGSVTNLATVGETVNISGGSVGNLMSTGGTTNITGSVSIGGAADFNSTHVSGIYLKENGTVNIGDGTTTNTVTVTRVEMGDNQSANGGVLNVKSNATLVITGGDVTEGQHAYHKTGLLLGEWESASTVNVAGKLLAENATLFVGDKTANVVIDNGGIMAVKGIGLPKVDNEKTQAINLTLNDGGKVVLGEAGINTSRTFSGVLGAGTIGISADAAINTALALKSSTGTTFDTQKYVWGEGGASIAQGTEGGTLSISGVVADHTDSSGKLVKAGAGTLELSGANTYSGGTDINAGTVKTSNDSALGTGDVSVAEGASLELGSSLTVSSNLTIDEGGSLIFGNGTKLTVTGTLTLANANDIKLAEGITFDSADEVKLATGTLALGEGFDATTWAGAGTYTINGVEYTSALKAEGDAISVTFKQMVEAPGEPISVTGWDLKGTALTLNVNAVLSEGMEVSVDLLDDATMQKILAKLDVENYKDGKPMVTITLQGTSGIITADKMNEVVFVKGDTGQNYWGEMVDGVGLMYNVERIPEPASATLSLAALMMLCARRRRRA